MARNDHASRNIGSPTDTRQFELPWSPAERAPTSPAQVKQPPVLPIETDAAGTAPATRDASFNSVPVQPQPTPDTAARDKQQRPRLSLRDRVERLLRDRGIPYVNVDEAKRALFASAKLRAFHFVAYAKAGPNWLIFAARADRRVRETMAEWEHVFGEGFLAVLATSADGEDAGIGFRSLDGKRLALTGSDDQRAQGGGHATRGWTC